MDGQLSTVGQERTVAIPSKRFVLRSKLSGGPHYSALFCNERIKARSSMGGISTRRWLPRGARARFLLHPPDPRTDDFRTPLFPFYFMANESCLSVRHDYIVSLNWKPILSRLKRFNWKNLKSSKRLLIGYLVCVIVNRILYWKIARDIYIYIYI